MRTGFWPDFCGFEVCFLLFCELPKGTPTFFSREKNKEKVWFLGGSILFVRQFFDTGHRLPALFRVLIGWLHILRQLQLAEGLIIIIIIIIIINNIIICFSLTTLQWKQLFMSSLFLSVTKLTFWPLSRNVILVLYTERPINIDSHFCI